MMNYFNTYDIFTSVNSTYIFVLFRLVYSPDIGKYFSTFIPNFVIPILYFSKIFCNCIFLLTIVNFNFRIWRMFVFVVNLRSSQAMLTFCSRCDKIGPIAHSEIRKT